MAMSSQVIYESDIAHEDPRIQSTRGSKNFYNYGTKAKGTCAAGTLSTGPTPADGSAFLLCLPLPAARQSGDGGASAPHPKIPGSMESLLSPSSFGGATQIMRAQGLRMDWSPSPPDGGYECSIAACPAQELPTGMIAVYTEGTYGLRTEGSQLSVACPASGFAPQPSGNTFLCKNGFWETMDKYKFNDLEIPAGHVFSDPQWAKSFLYASTQTLKGVWWNTAFNPRGARDDIVIPVGWVGNYYCEGVNCSPTYRVPNSFNPKYPTDTTPTYPPLYGFEAVNPVSRALYIAPLGTTYLYSCVRGYYLCWCNKVKHDP